MKPLKSGGGWPAIFYTLRKARQSGGLLKMYKALRTSNACKTCALGMGGQAGGMVNEAGRFPEVCKKSIQAMAADMAGAIRNHFFDDFSLEQLAAFSPRELEAAGRITTPLFAGPLDSHYKPISWDEANDRIVEKMGKITPEEAFFYFSGRSSNEAGFLLQLLARLWGTNNVNNCSYYCHQASGVGLTSVTGSGTATIVLDDLDGCDLIFLIGANPASNHPRFMRTIIDMKRRGARVIVINPLRETGLVRFKVPSDVRSMLFGSTIADDYVQPHIGGDIALLSGIAKDIIGRGMVDNDFVEQYTDGWPAVRRHLENLDWNDIVQRSGVREQEIRHLGELYARSKNTVFAWAMGITHHEHGVENVQMIGTLALLRGMVGQPNRGLLPLRGHSNVQGIGSMGVTPTLKDAIFERLESEYDVKLPTEKGLDTLGCMMRADADAMRMAWCLGGNLYGSNPDATFASQALRKIDLSVFLSTTLNTGHILGRGRESLILPVLARDEEAQTTTQESMFNYVRLSDGGPSRHEGPRAEVEVIADVGQRVLGESSPVDWEAMRQHGTIREAIAKIIPGYEKIGEVDGDGGEFHIDGRTFHEPRFATDNGRAKFHVIDVPTPRGNPDVGELRLMTVRSEGQFNTVVYEEEDVYRGQERRDVILLNPSDLRKHALVPDQRVTVRSEAGALENVLVRPYDIPPGNACMYYPEANVLVPRTADAQSRTPAFKSVVIRLEA